MKNKLKLLPLLGLCALTLFSCKKDDKDKEVMPDYTTTGENTFGANVNGKLWIPNAKPSFSTPKINIVYQPGYNGGMLEIRANRKVKENPSEFEIMRFGMDSVNHEGVYLWDRPNFLKFRDESCYYVNDSVESQEGWLEITKLDLQNGIISGKFEFTVISPECNDTIRVTDGRFDWKL